LNRDIVGAMLTVKELMLTDGTVVEPPVADDEADDAGADGDEDDEDEQPAAVRARAAARASQPSRGRRRNVPSPREREPRPPSFLSPSVIPIPLSHESTGISQRGDLPGWSGASEAVGPSAGRPRIPFTRP
jgi:hypothetical protein